MVTIKLALLRSTRSKNGTYKIRIAIGHKSETHYIVTKYTVNSPSEFQDGVVVRLSNAHQMNIELRNLLNDYEDRLERIPNPSDYSCQQLRDLLKNMRPKVSTATYNQVSESYRKELTEDGRASYAGMLANTQRLFGRFNNGDVFLSQITATTISELERWMRHNGSSQTYININLSLIRTIINLAIRQQLVKYDLHPFTYWHRQADEYREIDLSVEAVRAIRDSNPHLKKERLARDIFMLSYYLGGINLIDLLAIKFKGVSILEYSRTKTRNMKRSDKRISFTIQPEAKAIIDKYINRNTGRLDFGYKFQYRNFLSYVTRSIKSLCIRLGVDNAERACYYSARKSFVQHGFDLGIPLETLEYCIGQTVKSNRPIFNYLKIMRRHADVAMRRIFDNLSDLTTTRNE